MYYDNKDVELPIAMLFSIPIISMSNISWCLICIPALLAVMPDWHRILYIIISCSIISRLRKLLGIKSDEDEKQQLQMEGLGCMYCDVVPVILGVLDPLDKDDDDDDDKRLQVMREADDDDEEEEETDNGMDNLD